MQVKQSEKKEIGRIKLSETRDLVATLVEGEKLDLRVYVESKTYTGWTKQGLRFYLFDEIWEGFKKLMSKVDKEYQEIA
jgi:hypothetical protein